MYKNFISSPLSINTDIEQVVSIAQALPKEANLNEILTDAQNAENRGYYLPDEDERLRHTYVNYLRLRSTLLETIYNLQPRTSKSDSWPQDIEAFTTAYTAACLLIRATSYIIKTAESKPVIWNKLDEEEGRYGIERKSLTGLYKNLTSPTQMWHFFQATKFYHAQNPDILSLKSKSQAHRELIELLMDEQPFVEAKRSEFLKKRLKYRFYDFIRRNKSGYKKTMFHIFRLSGSAIAELKQPFKTPKTLTTTGKRVGRKTIAEIKECLLPGDIIITRHDDALSNLFLPGFWPHAAFYIGDQGGDISVIEAKKDGVKLRPLDETLYVDNFIILRSNLSLEFIEQVIGKAKSHVGKRYDFLFDFKQADRLACTELIYRSFHATDHISFNLQEHAGRMCLTAENLIDQSIRDNQFKCIAIYGLEQASKSIIYDKKAQEILKTSYTSNW